MLLVPHITSLLFNLLLLSGLDAVIHILSEHIKSVIQLKNSRMNSYRLHGRSGIFRKTGSITAASLTIDKVRVQTCILIPLHLRSR